MSKTEKKIERRGGARPNAGRPPGGGAMSERRKLMKQITLDMLKREVVPLRVMLQNMDFYDQEASKLEATIAEKMEDIKLDPEQLVEALRLLEKIGDARMKAQHCAMQAAPYCHARFAQVQHTIDAKVETVTHLPPDDMQRVREEYRRLRAMPFVQPVQTPPVMIGLMSEDDEDVAED